MKKILLLSMLAAMTLSSCVSDPEPICNIPSVSLGENGKGYRDEGKGEDGELKRTSVQLCATCSVHTGAKVTELGFIVGETIGSLESDTAKKWYADEITSNHIANYLEELDFIANLEKLEINHTYFFFAYLVDGKKTMRSNIGTFHTKSEGYALVTFLSQNGNIMKAEIKDDGGSKIKRVGFCWSTNANPDIFNDSITATIGKDNKFSAYLPSLESGKNYHLRAFADNGTDGDRISYSEDILIPKK